LTQRLQINHNAPSEFQASLSRGQRLGFVE
jgi:hypothetical protein